MKKPKHKKRRVRAPRRPQTVNLSQQASFCLTNLRSDVRALNALIIDKTMMLEERVQKIKCAIFNLRNDADILLSAVCVDYPTYGN